MSKFVFFDRFSELNNQENIKVGDAVLNKLCDMDENCLGHRKVNDISYHIFYIKHNNSFGVYYHGGGADPIFESMYLDKTLNYVNNLTAK